MMSNKNSRTLQDNKMTKYLAECTLTSDLCLPENQPRLVLHDKTNGFSLTLMNVALSEASLKSTLKAYIEYNAPSIKEAHKAALDNLTHALNALVYSTNHKFSFERIHQIFDWTPGLVEREGMMFIDKNPREIAIPELSSDFIDTANWIASIRSGSKEETAAMRWYRLGIADNNLEDQFTYFWFALEIIAESLKEPTKISSKCPKCRHDLYCEQCKEAPLHKPYRGEAIKQLIESLNLGNSEEDFKTLQLIRHTLLHGKQIFSIEDQIPLSASQAVDKLAFIVWNAINKTFNKPNPAPADRDFVFGDPDSVVRNKMTAAVHLRTVLNGGHENPQIENLPTGIKLSLT